MSLKRGTAAMFISMLLRNLLSFAAVAYFSRAVGTAALGSFFLFQSLLSLLQIPADFGMQNATEKRISEGEPAGSVVGSALAFKITTVSVFSVGIMLLRGYIADFIGVDVAPLLAIGLLLTEFAQLGNHTLRGEQRVSETAYFDPIQTAIWILFGAVLIEIGFGLIALFYSYIAGFLLVGIIAFWRIESTIGKPSLARVRSMFDYSKFAMIGSIGGIVYNWADVMLLGFLATQTSVGAYEVVWRVATASLVLSNAVRTSIFPQANAWGAKDQTARLEELIENALVPSLYLVIPAVVGGAVLGDRILPVIFDIQYPMVHLVLVVLLLEKLQRAVVVVLISPMHAIGRVDLGMYTTILGLGVNIALNLALIPTFGIVGAAIGTTTGSTVKTIAHSWVLSRYVDIKIPYRNIVWCCFAAAIMGGAIVALRIIFVPSTIFGVSLVIGGAGILYVAFTLLSADILETVKQEVGSVLG